MAIWRFEGSDANEAFERRSDYVIHLRRYAEPESDFDSAELIYGELVGNVARHVGGPIRVRVDWENRFAVLHVHDTGPGFRPSFRLPEPTSESGRGLYIVKQLAHDLDVDDVPAGCIVRAVLPVTRCLTQA